MAVRSSDSEPGRAHSTSVSVDDSETWVEAKRYTVYKVVVRVPEKAYFVFRRWVGGRVALLYAWSLWGVLFPLTCRVLFEYWVTRPLH